MSWLRSCLAGLVAAACAHAAAADGKAAAMLSGRWMSAYNSGDVDALAGIYARDARIRQGFCPAVRGRRAIAEFWNEDLAEGGVRTELYVLDSLELGDVVYLSGDYSVIDPHRGDGAVGGTFSQVWRRDRGSDWSLHRESWNNFACLEVETQRPDGDEPPDRAPDV